PSRIGSFGHQYAAGLRGCGWRILYYTHPAAHPAGTRPKPTTFLPVGGRFLDIWAGLTLVSLVHGLWRLKAVGRRRVATHLLEFMLAKGHQLLELGCDCGTVNECQDLFHLEIKNVAGIVQQAKRTKPLSDFYENAAHTSEYACPFEAQIFPRADSRASV